MRLYLIRHAEPDYANNTITAAGHLEAKALAQRLAREGLDKIYYSPLGRAIDTMKYTAELTKIEPHLEPWTREFSHDVEIESWGRMPVCDIPGEVARLLQPGETHDTWHQRPPYNCPEIISKIETVRTGSDDFIKRHGYERDGELFRCVKPNREKIAVFCHANLTTTWLAYLLGIHKTIMWSGFWLPPSSVTTVLFEERSENWAAPRCIGFGDVSHLYSSGLPVSTMGLTANIY